MYYFEYYFGYNIIKQIYIFHNLYEISLNIVMSPTYIWYLFSFILKLVHF